MRKKTGKEWGTRSKINRERKKTRAIKRMMKSRWQV